MPPIATSSRRKPKDDDAAYIGSSGSKRNRDSADKTSIDGRRTKRKKVQQTTTSTVHGQNGRMTTMSSGIKSYESAPTMVDFTTFSRENLHRYLTYYNIVPIVYPSPLTASEPMPPAYLLDPPTFPSPPPSLSPTNSQRRESVGRDHRRRSSRLIDDENGNGRTAILADIGDVDIVLAKIAEQHFRDEVVREVDTLASFMFTLKTNARIP